MVLFLDKRGKDKSLECLSPLKQKAMKKILTLSFCFAMFISVSAQKKTTVGIRAGYNFYTIHGRYANGDNFWLKTEDGMHVGADVEIPVGKNLYLQPGILYNQKGANFDDYFLVW